MIGDGVALLGVLAPHRRKLHVLEPIRISTRRVFQVSCWSAYITPIYMYICVRISAYNMNININMNMQYRSYAVQ